MNHGSLEYRAAKVSLVTGISTGLSVAFQLISVPICLRYWGQETYGSWLVLFSSFLLLRSLDAGYVAYVGNKLNYLYHQNTQALREHLASAVTGIALIGSMQLLLAAGAMMSDWLATIFGLPSGDTAGELDMLGLVVLMLSWVLSGSYVGIVHRLMIPAGLMYQAAWWSMVFQVSQFAAIIAASILQLSIFKTCILFALLQVVIYLTSAIYVRMKLPSYYPWWQGVSLGTGLRDLSQSVILTVSNLLRQGATNGVVLLVSALAGPVAVPVFTTVRTISNLWTNVTNVLTTPLLPDVVRFHAKGEAPKLIAITGAHWVVVGSAVNLGVLLVYPLIPVVYGYWTGHIVTLDKALLCLLLGSVVLTNAGSLMEMHLNGINSLRIVLGVSTVRGVIGLGVGALTYGSLGLAGFGLGILMGEIFALLMTGGFFIKYELADKGLVMPTAVYAPTALGTISVMFFLANDGFGWLPTLWVWPVTLVGVICGAVGGWIRLDQDLRIRLMRMITSRFAGISGGM